jgi:hypothetical protein
MSVGVEDALVSQNMIREYQFPANFCEAVGHAKSLLIDVSS